MKLEEQLDRLKELGLSLNDGLTADDLLDAWPRDQYESVPFRLLLAWLGAEIDREPWVFSPDVLCFDCECIDDPGSYVSLLRDVCVLASAELYVTEIEDLIDFENNSGWIQCRIDGSLHRWDVEVCGDWIDAIALAKVMAKIERNEKHFYCVENDGQTLTLLYLSSETANSLQALTNLALNPMAETAG